jgi:hypothetical protein
MRVGISVTAPTTPGTLTNSGLTFGCNRTHEHGRARGELVVAVANHHCNGLKQYLYSRLYQAFLQKLFTLYRALSTPSPVSAASPCLLRESNACPLQEFPRRNRGGFLDKSAAWEKRDW